MYLGQITCISTPASYWKSHAIFRAYPHSKLRIYHGCRQKTAREDMPAGLIELAPDQGVAEWSRGKCAQHSTVKIWI